MIKAPSLNRSMMNRRFSHSHRPKLHTFLTISFGTVFFFTLYIFYTHTLTLTTPIQIQPLVSNNLTFIVQHVKLTSYPIPKPTHIAKETVITQESVLSEGDDQRSNDRVRIAKEFDILKSTALSRRFKKRVHEFLKNGSCKVRFFMIWMSSSIRVFGEREFLVLDALFKSNPDSCLMIVSNSMDSDHGFRILKPMTDLGFRVQAITPDLGYLFKNTPAQAWLDHIKNGKRKPGKIPLPQNLSNLIRLAILYKYGGVYIDTDFVVLKDFSGLRNSIGAQSATKSGNWTRLNNAVLIFDKNHPLLYKFMEEFASNFDGNKWGYNGPYLVSRVVEREAIKLDTNFTVLHPRAFYPVDWTRVGGFFTSPVNQIHRRWIDSKISQLNSRWTYGVHLWNKQSSRLKIEKESIMAKLVHDYCVICNVE